MARGINKVILIGNLGNDPEVKYTAGGSAVANVTIATSENWKDKATGENQEHSGQTRHPPVSGLFSNHGPTSPLLRPRYAAARHSTRQQPAAHLRN